MNKYFVLLSTVLLMCACSNREFSTSISCQSTPRIAFGLQALMDVLKSDQVDFDQKLDIEIKLDSTLAKAESFKIEKKGSALTIAGADQSGILYGCLEAATLAKKGKILEENWTITDAPEMKLRGTCIGLQKTTYLPGRQVYEYPYTPESFPWFYDKSLWIKYLDMMVENRYNSLYLWNGHPFASLVKLKDYPNALEVDEETFRKNEEIFTFLTTEADKRGIWVIQMFYNIILPKPLADEHGIKTQERSRPIFPLAEDYTRKSIAAFVEKYPNVGLLVALGEAMQGIENDVNWFTNTIIPGVKDGLAALGQTNQPPIVLRGHDTDAAVVMQHALPLYSNLFTLNKYNGESLTTYAPKGKWAAYHKSLSELGSTHIDNVHILANLEPFRYGSPDFIQKSVKAMHSAHGANGLHLYPQTSYWDWPYAPDLADTLLLEMDRDRIWYEAWARYAWKADRERNEEIEFWSALFEEKFGCENCGKDILEAYEVSGEISPMILRRYGITEGNRQTMTLGMLMGQLVSPEKFSLNKMVNESHSPLGELLSDFAKIEAEGLPHEGETPLWAADEIVKYAASATAAINRVEGVTRESQEFERLKNDMYCYEAMAQFYSAKVKAALAVLKYGHSGKIADLEATEPYLEASVQHWEQLVALTKNAYRYANSMQTSQRRIPVGGDEGRNKTWEELLPFYQTELINFRRNLELLKATNGSLGDDHIKPLTAVKVDYTGGHDGRYALKAGSFPFTEKQYVIKAVAKELSQLEGVRFSFKALDDFDTEIKFTVEEPVQMVVGFFQSDKTEFLSPPTLEIDASANFYGQADIKILNAIEIGGLPPVNVHTYFFEPGTHSLLFDNDVFLILGFIPGDAVITPRDAGLGRLEKASGLDWLFY